MTPFQWAAFEDVYRHRLNDLDEVQRAIEDFRETVGRGAGGRELALVQTKLDEARMWLVQAAAVVAKEVK